MIGQMISLAFALLGAAAVYGTDVFFCVVGRTALAHSACGPRRTMGRLHEVANRRMPVHGVIGLVRALAWASSFLGSHERSRRPGPVDRRLPKRSGARER
jgi:hypothetical protein